MLDLTVTKAKRESYAKSCTLAGTTTAEYTTSLSNLETIIKKSKKSADLAKKLTNARDSNLKPKVQDSLRRLLGVCDTVIKP